MSTRVVILTKEPIEGTVKTRLIPGIGAKSAAALHTELVWETIERVQKSGLPVRVALAGSIDSPFANEIRRRGLSIEKQIHGDLGQRMAHALRGPGKTFAMGTDCVVFEPGWLRSAAVANDPVTIGPADDGGYWLIGVHSDSNEVYPAIFQNMEWSTSSVCRETEDRLNGLSKTIHWLPRAYDIDTMDDIRRLQSDQRCPDRIRRCLQSISQNAH